MRFIYGFLFFVCFSAGAQTKPFNDEMYVWNHSWIVARPSNTSQPQVLVIGDSHAERYYPVVTNLLKDKATVSKITTSLSMGDPSFMPHLSGLLGNFTFDYIFFNNGLHGVLYSPAEYASYISKVYKLLKKNNSSATIIWVNTTARRVPNQLESFDAFHADVIERNKYVAAFCAKKNVKVLDFFSLTVNDKSLFTQDGIHVNEAGVAAQAKLIAAEVK